MRATFKLPDSCFAALVGRSGPGGVLPGPGDAPDLGPYPASRLANARRALAITYPTVAQLLGDQAFDVLCGRFAPDSPHLQADWGNWGVALPAWLTRQPELSQLPYLPDVARLDALCHASERASDARLDVASLQRAASRQPESLRLCLAPQVGLLSSPHPVLAIWWAHHGPQVERAHWLALANLPLPEGSVSHVLVQRAAWRATPVELPASTLAFLRAVQSGRSLAQALGEVAPSGFDFVHWLPQAIQQGWVIGFAEFTS